MSKEKEYIYNHCYVWKEGTPEALKVKPRFLATMIKEEKGKYCFKAQGFDVIYHTYYGWSFIENTTYNKLRLKVFDLLEKSIELLALLRNKVKPKTLSN